MALILSIETSTTSCSVALHDSGKLIVLSETHMEQAHATKLGLLIDQIRASSGIDFTKLNAIAVSSGPGSYTGLRIGASVAKGLCMALGVPLISVETLDVLAAHAYEGNVLRALRCPMIDARRMEVYCKVISPENEVIRPVEAKVIDENSFQDLLASSKILFFGDGASKCKTLIKSSGAFFLEDVHPSAREVGVLAFEKFKQSQIEDLVHFEPFYLKEFMIKPPAKSAVNELSGQ